LLCALDVNRFQRGLASWRMPPILRATADGSVKKGKMIGWILRRVRESNCDHKWGGPHEIRMYGR
jgi:hypothetical protein